MLGNILNRNLTPYQTNFKEIAFARGSLNPWQKNIIKKNCKLHELRETAAAAKPPKTFLLNSLAKRFLLPQTIPITSRFIFNNVLLPGQGSEAKAIPQRSAL